MIELFTMFSVGGRKEAFKHEDIKKKLIKFGFKKETQS